MGRWRLRFSFYLALVVIFLTLGRNYLFQKHFPTDTLDGKKIRGIILKKISGSPEYRTYILETKNPRSEKFLLRCFTPTNFSPQDIVKIDNFKIRFLSPAKNPGEFSWQKFYQRQKIWREILVNNSEEISYRGYRKNRKRFFTELREKIDWRLAELIPDKNLCSIAGKMLFGSAEHLDNEWRQFFVNSGVMHILVVSGLHVGYIAVFGYWLFSLTGIRRRYGFFFLLPLLLFYWQLCLESPPVSRATIMTLAFLAAFYLKRESEVFNTLCLAATVILLFEPGALTGASFQLSFAATLGLILGVTLWPISESETISFGKNIRNKIKSLIIASLSAQIFTMPLIAYYFGRISLVALLVNIQVIPLAGLVVWVTALYLLFADLPLVGFALRHLTNYSLFLLTVIVRFFGRFSFSSLLVRKPDIFPIIIFYLFLLFILWLSQQNKKYLYLIIPNVLLFLLPLKTSLFPQMQLTFLSVGLGRAAVLETPDNRTILVDCGAISEKYASRVISGFLATRGISKIDTVIITDDNYLYFNALEELIFQYKIKEIILPPKIAPESELNLIKDNFPAASNYLRPPTYLNYGGMELFFFGENRTTLKIKYRRDTILILGNTDWKNWPPEKHFSAENSPLVIEITNFGENKRSQKLSGIIRQIPTILISRQDNPEKEYPNKCSVTPKTFNLTKGAVIVKIKKLMTVYQF